MKEPVDMDRLFMHFINMKKISSWDNRICRTIRLLESRKGREREGLYLIEGENLISEAVSEGAFIEFIAVREDRVGIYENLLGELIEKTYILEEKIFDRLAQTMTSQGILGAVRINRLSEEDFLKAVSCGNVVVLDRLQDPGNIGTIIRTADAAGYSGVLLIKGTGDIYSPKVIRAAAGSVFRIPALYAAGAREGVELLEKAGKTIIGTAFDTSHMYYSVDMTDNVAVVIGNEGNGISDEMKKACHINVKIPMLGNIESLNASVAAGILIYESMRQEKEKCRTS